MNPISPDIAETFCELCKWAHECWSTHKRLFDENDRKEETIGKAEYFTKRLSTITQGYALLQICKLHDPAIQGSSLNITIDYIWQFGDWGSDAEKIKAIISALNTLFEKIKSARNKAIAHNDLAALMGEETTLGAFPDGLDEKYFSALQKLADAVHLKWFDVPYPFKDRAGVDVDAFLDTLETAKYKVP